MITRLFGTPRGAIRLGLSYIESLPGLSHAVSPDPEQVRRLVFVCHGNICRSAFADIVARSHGMEVASFGLSTSTGKGAHPPVVEAALAMGHDLGAHVTTDVSDFSPREGDYLLGMEHRHLRKLASDPTLASLPRGLLGSYASPPVPHLHDPYQLDAAYLPTCLERIERATKRLCASYPSARKPS